MIARSNEIFVLTISRDLNTFVAWRFIADLIKAHGKHPVSTDDSTWYPMACKFLK